MEAQRARLPEGVGRKIVEALKQQTIEINEIQDEALEAYETQLDETSETNDVNAGQYENWSTEIYEPVQPVQTTSEFAQMTVEEYKYSDSNEDEFDNFDYYEETTPSIPQSQPAAIPAVNTFNVNPTPPASQAKTIQPPLSPITVFKQPVKTEVPMSIEFIQTEFEIPTNVEVLRRLISQLPAGVTKQTGAQIIRQTMEAMGLSINNVLSEAQMVQENLGSAAKESLSTIEEYKNNIKILEVKIQNYKRQADQLGDLINLFILSEPKK